MRLKVFVPGLADVDAEHHDSGVVAGTRSWFLRHLARPRTAQEFVPQIDGLRFVAIVSVLLYHMHGYVMAKAAAVGSTEAGWLHRLFGEGHYGVPLFFALSGYILGRPFLGSRQVPLSRYFLRRLTRLEPPYVINLLLVFTAKVLLLGVAFADLWPSLLASLAYSHGLVFGSHSLVNGCCCPLKLCLRQYRGKWRCQLPCWLAGLLRQRFALAFLPKLALWLAQRLGLLQLLRLLQPLQLL